MAKEAKHKGSTKLFGTVLALAVLSVSLYIVCDMQVVFAQLGSGYSLQDSISIKQSKSEFIAQYNVLQTVTEIQGMEKIEGVNINPDYFSKTAIRLNTEIYQIAAEVINQEHFSKCYGTVSETPMFLSFKEKFDPLMAIALANVEGKRFNMNYTFSQAIYSQNLSPETLEGVVVDSVDSDFYIMNGLSAVFECASGCKGNHNMHIANVSGSKFNGGVSMGPLQILRTHLKGTGNTITYSGCGYTVTDLMSWRDNVEWFFHSQADGFTSKYIKNRVLTSDVELFALIAVAHNSGTAFLTRNLDDVYRRQGWRDTEAIWEWCKMIGAYENEFNEYIEAWWVDAKERLQSGKPIQIPSESTDAIGFCNRYKIDLSPYNRAGVTGSWVMNSTHRQYYAVEAVLIYKALQKLYTSGMG